MLRILVTHDLVQNTRMALRLRQTKTGPNQWVEVEDNQVKTLLMSLLQCHQTRGNKLLPFTANQFRSVFKETCAELGLSPGYVPHSLRHGGATRAHLLGRPLEDILMRGRWASTKSARRYIQSGRAILLATSVPRVIANSGHVLASNILLSLSLSLPQLH